MSEPQIRLHFGEAHEERSVKSIFRDISRQIVVSLIILVVGFFAINYSAYLKIIKNEFNKYFGTEEMITNETHDFTETVPSNSALAANEIPNLNLEVVPSDNRILIQRINQNIPVIRTSSQSLINRDWNALEKELLEALRDGVVHYPGTALPGQNGNVVITGHSSYFPWDSGKFKDVFALLHEVVIGDRIIVYYDQEKYVYEVEDIKVVLPNNIDVLLQNGDDKLTLITCTPVGTNLKRLIVIAKPV